MRGDSSTQRIDHTAVNADGYRKASRRSFLQCGMLAAGGLSLADGLQWEAAARAIADDRSTRDVSVILLWMDGGASHFETCCWEMPWAWPSTCRASHNRSASAMVDTCGAKGRWSHVGSLKRVCAL